MLDGGATTYDRRGHARAAPEPDRVPADHDRGRGAAGDHHRHRRRRASDATRVSGARSGVSCPKSQLQAHGPSNEHATIEHAQPAVHRPRVGRGDRRGARQPACGSRSAGTCVWLSLGPRRRRVRAGGARPAHGRVRPQAAVRDGALPASRSCCSRDALVLVRRAGQPDGPAHTVVSRRTVVLGRVLRRSRAHVVLFTGTSSPAPVRTAVAASTDDVARLDLRSSRRRRACTAGWCWIFLAAVLSMLWLLRRDRAPRSVHQRVTLLLVRARRAGRDRLHPVLQRHPRVARRRARRRRDRGVERDAVLYPGDVRTHARSRRCPTRARPTPCLHRPESHGEAGPVPSPFRFDRSWHFGVSPEELWTTLAPHRPVPRVVAVVARVRRSTVATRRSRTGAQCARVVIQAPLPYQLHCTVRRGRRRAATQRLVDHRRRRSRAARPGWSCTPIDDGTEARLAWALELRAAAPALAGAWSRGRRWRGHTTGSSNAGSCSSRGTRSASAIVSPERQTMAAGRGASRDFMRLATLPTFSTCFTRRSRACSAAALRFCSCSIRQCLNTTGTRIWSWCDGEVVDAGVGDDARVAS